VTQHRGGNLDGAIEAYSEAIKIDPKFAIAFDLRGNAFEGKGDVGKAVSDYTKAISLEPKLVKAVLDRGLLMRSEGHMDAALSDFDKLVKLTKDAGAYVQRGITHFDRNDFDRAIKDFTAAIDKAPGNVEAYQYRSAVYAKKGDVELARADHAKAEAIATGMSAGPRLA